jgi:hypothetical protein
LNNPNVPLLTQNIVLNSNSPILLNLPTVPANSWVKFRTTINDFPLAAILDSVRVEELPTAEIVYEIQNGMLALSANGANGSSVEWLVNGEVVSDQEVYSFEITSPQYSIDLNTTNQCGTSTANLEVNITGFELLIPTDWNLFPNPTKGEVNLKTRLPFESYLISDVTGRILLANQSNGFSNCETINIQSLTSGIYFCTVLFNGKSSTKKLIVN